MKILFLAQNINIGSRTGDAIHVRELVMNLAKLGNRITLFAWCDSLSSDLAAFKHPNINHYNTINIKNNFFLIMRCLLVLRKEPHDIIYERCFSCKIGTILSKLSRLPFVVEINGLVDDEKKMQGKRVSITRHKIGQILRKVYFSQTNKIVAVSPGIKKELINNYNIKSEKIEIVPNGANTDLFKPMDQAKAKIDLGLSQEYKYICFVGNLAPWQGIEYLISLAPAVIKKIPNIKFLIVGDGIMKRTWEAMVKNKGLSNNFIFVGSVPFEEVPKYINASDICAAIFSPNRKCSPIKVFEYLSCAKPVLLNDIGNEIKIFDNSKSTIMVSFDDTNKFADQLYQILSNEKLIKQMGIEGRKFIMENYTWKNTAQKVIKICESKKINSVP